MLTLAIGTAALFIVLSVFNGLSGLITQVHNAFDPDLKVEPSKGKTMVLTEEQYAKIKGIEGVNNISEVLEDDAFLYYKEEQRVVKVKGVPDSYFEDNNLSEFIIKGEGTLGEARKPMAVLGRGIQYDLNISLKDEFNAIRIWYPKRKAKSIRDHNSFNTLNIFPGGVFEIERQYDDVYTFVSLASAKRLFNYEKEISALEINLKEGVKAKLVHEKIQEILGTEFTVLNSEEQHETLYRAIKLERLIAIVIFVFILSIAVINIFLTLMMIVINKKRDIAVLKATGASDRQIFNIFFKEGLIIGVIGSAIGLAFGITVCWLQENYGFYGMDIQSSITESFPVKMEVPDIFITALITMGVTALISLPPAIKASEIEFKGN